MESRLLLQLHIHTHRSYDCSTPLQAYIRYLHEDLRPSECAILGVTDHNVVPLSVAEALEQSTEKVLVIPGIEWEMHKTVRETITKLCVRRELITLGNQDTARDFLKKCNYTIKNDEVQERIREEDLISYIQQNPALCMLVPHPRHIGIDYYGPTEIYEFHKKIQMNHTQRFVFVEKYNGHNLLPRVFRKGYDRFKILAGSDAHELFSCLGTNSLYSVKAWIPATREIIGQWKKSVQTHNTQMYTELLLSIFEHLHYRNKEIVIEKHQFRRMLHFASALPQFVKTRFTDFPKNLLR